MNLIFFEKHCFVFSFIFARCQYKTPSHLILNCKILLLNSVLVYYKLRLYFLKIISDIKMIYYHNNNSISYSNCFNRPVTILHCRISVKVHCSIFKTFFAFKILIIFKTQSFFYSSCNTNVCLFKFPFKIAP